MPSLPLNLFNSFEAVARNLSFSLAAKELHLSQSAVSKQISMLEKKLSVRLFHRKHRSIELTEEGQEIYNSVKLGLDQILQSIEKYQVPTDYPQITVSTSVSFAFYWLIPRLQKFNNLYPNIDVKVISSNEPVNFRKDGSDIAVLFGDGQWDNMTTELLFKEVVYALCSESYLESHPEILKSEWANQTLIHLKDGTQIQGGVDWNYWANINHISEMPHRRGIELNSFPMVVQAMEAGRGIGLGWDYAVHDLVKSGRLIRLQSQEFETGNGYYVSLHNHNRPNQFVRKFLGWIVEEANSNAK